MSHISWRTSVADHLSDHTQTGGQCQATDGIGLIRVRRADASGSSAPACSIARPPARTRHAPPECPCAGHVVVERLGHADPRSPCGFTRTSSASTRIRLLTPSPPLSTGTTRPTMRSVTVERPSRTLLARAMAKPRLRGSRAGVCAAPPPGFDPGLRDSKSRGLPITPRGIVVAGIVCHGVGRATR